MNLPKDFTTYTRQLMGDELFEQYLSGMEEESPTSIRINPFKYKKDIDANYFPQVPWCPSTGHYLSERKNFTFDPMFHAGVYYVQEASSMFVDLAIRQYVKEPVVMLDLCAAPGGKSTAIRAALPDGSLLFSNEPMRTRSQILAENIQKFGHPEVVVTNNYPRDYKQTKLLFDIILADVPCSGEGMFRKDEGAIKEWSLNNVNNCWKLQREIVSDIWDNLKPNGILIYSTCTYNAHEDEENVAWIQENLGAELLPLDIKPEWNITNSLTDNQEVYHFIPGKTRGEGLFLAVLRKTGSHKEETTHRSNKKDKKSKGNKDNAKKPTVPTNWLKPTLEWSYLAKEDCIYALPSKWLPQYEEGKKSLKIIHAGIKMGITKGKDLIPDQSLALSTALDKESFPQVELSYEDAIKYLRKEAVTLPIDTPKGYVLVTYKGYPLGWEKNIGNRANNLYPQEWKIKSTHIPENNNEVLA